MYGIVVFCCLLVHVAGHSALMKQNGGGSIGELKSSVQNECRNTDCIVAPVGNYYYPQDGQKFLNLEQFTVRERMMEAFKNWRVMGDNGRLTGIDMKDPNTCGRYDANARVTLDNSPVPVRVVNDYTGHQGPAEIYVDDRLVFQTPNLQGPTREPGFSGKYTVDRNVFNCDKESCMVRFMWSVRRFKYEQLYGMF